MGMPGSEGLVLGAGHNLPDASIVQNFDFPSEGRLSLSVWELPDHPDAVLRLHRDFPADEESCWQLARQGITHLRELQEEGIAMPAQRFVVGPDQYSRWRKPRLYSITERLPKGRELTFEQADIERAQTVITGTAKYLLRRVVTHPDSKDPTILFDTGYPWQYTVFDKNTTDFMLHDIGLEFTNLREHDVAGTLRYLGVLMVHWADYAGLERPTAVNEFLRHVEPRRQRAMRTVREAVYPALKHPVMPPANWSRSVRIV